MGVTERLMQPGNAVLVHLGIDVQALANSRRPLFRCCRWLVAVPESRKLDVTALGREMFVKVIGVDSELFAT